MSEVHALGQPKRRRLWQLVALLGLLALAVLAITACQPVQPVAPAGSAAAGAEEATAVPAAEPAALQGDAERGGYILAMTRGCGCHFNRDLGGPAGGNKFEGPFGVVYASNISQDPETGIGGWTEAQLVDALRLGVGSEGQQLHPIMPYMAWSTLSDQDAYDLAAFVMTWPAIVNEVPAREVAEEPQPFAPANPPAAEAPTEPAARGMYIARLNRCGECHTPRNENGAPDMTRLLAGAPLRDTIAPNLTPDEATGLGGIADEDIVHYLMTGEYEDGSMVEGPMAMVIENSTSKLTEEDNRALVAFLRSLPPVENQPE
jgi:mono/diheme cytochrome c family protein